VKFGAATGSRTIQIDDRCVVDGGDVDCHRRIREAAVAIAQAIGEAGRSVVVGRRDEGDLATGAERHRSAGYSDLAAGYDRLAVDLGDGQRIAVRITIGATGA
jgi:hypothetical protein